MGDAKGHDNKKSQKSAHRVPNYVNVHNIFFFMLYLSYKWPIRQAHKIKTKHVVKYVNISFESAKSINKTVLLYKHGAKSDVQTTKT